MQYLRQINHQICSKAILENLNFNQMLCKATLEEKTTQEANYQEYQMRTSHRKSEENVFQEIWNPEPPMFTWWEWVTR